MATLPIPFPNPGCPRKKVDTKRVLELRVKGVSWRRIAKRLGVRAWNRSSCSGGVPKMFQNIKILVLHLSQDIQQSRKRGYDLRRWAHRGREGQAVFARSLGSVRSKGGVDLPVRRLSPCRESLL